MYQAYKENRMPPLGVRDVRSVAGSSSDDYCLISSQVEVQLLAPLPWSTSSLAERQVYTLRVRGSIPWWITMAVQDGDCDGLISRIAEGSNPSAATIHGQK